MEHNRRIVWARLCSALAAQAALDANRVGGLHREMLRDLARFEARRFETACYALSTTI